MQGRTKYGDIIEIPIRMTEQRLFRPYKRVKCYDKNTGILIATYQSVNEAVDNLPFSKKVFNKIMNSKSKTWNNYVFEMEDAGVVF